MRSTHSASSIRFTATKSSSFSPRARRGIYTRPRTISAIRILNDPFEPDLKKFPLFSQALQCRFVLGPGETIFNRAGWWHATRMLTPSVAVVISAVNRANWHDFSADIGRNRAGVPVLVTAALRAYLAVAGALLTAKERMFFHMIE